MRLALSQGNGFRHGPAQLPLISDQLCTCLDSPADPPPGKMTTDAVGSDAPASSLGRRMCLLLSAQVPRVTFPELGDMAVPELVRLGSAVSWTDRVTLWSHRLCMFSVAFGLEVFWRAGGVGRAAWCPTAGGAAFQPPQLPTLCPRLAPLPCAGTSASCALHVSLQQTGFFVVLA